MREIKFRGVRLSDGQTIFGYFHKQKGDSYIDEWRVDENSVSQFVGYDAEGNDHGLRQRKYR